MKGVTLADMVRMAEALHLQRARRCAPSWMTCRSCSALHPALGHEPLRRAGGLRAAWALIHDPARGLRRVKLDEVSRHFTGVALELTPAADFTPPPSAAGHACASCWGRSAGSSARWRRSSCWRWRSSSSCC
jgi:ATP-binding cassette, subfamily B, bacterial CvaB/MchF/RaxB